MCDHYHRIMQVNRQFLDSRKCVYDSDEGEIYVKVITQ